ncbi:hypothetical protein PGB90_006073 [Kerria lacca]
MWARAQWRLIYGECVLSNSPLSPGMEGALVGHAKRMLILFNDGPRGFSLFQLCRNRANISNGKTRSSKKLCMDDCTVPPRRTGYRHRTNTADFSFGKTDESEFEISLKLLIRHSKFRWMIFCNPESQLIR